MWLVGTGWSRQTVHAWLRRYANDGLVGSRGPDRRSRCRVRIRCQLRLRLGLWRCVGAHPGWGPRTIGSSTRAGGCGAVAGRSSIYRCSGPSPSDRARRPEAETASDYERWERSRSMELWQMDIIGGVLLVDGSELKVVTGIDDHSRFCVSAKVGARATARPVCDALAEAMRRHGVSESDPDGQRQGVHRAVRTREPVRCCLIGSVGRTGSGIC